MTVTKKFSRAGEDRGKVGAFGVPLEDLPDERIHVRQRRGQKPRRRAREREERAAHPREEPGDGGRVDPRPSTLFPRPDAEAVRGGGGGLCHRGEERTKRLGAAGGAGRRRTRGARGVHVGYGARAATRGLGASVTVRSIGAFTSNGERACGA